MQCLSKSDDPPSLTMIYPNPTRVPPATVTPLIDDSSSVITHNLRSQSSGSDDSYKLQRWQHTTMVNDTDHTYFDSGHIFQLYSINFIIILNCYIFIIFFITENVLYFCYIFYYNKFLIFLLNLYLYFIIYFITLN
jgi:hypothetical protein